MIGLGNSIPGLGLHIRWFGEYILEPPSNGWFESRQDVIGHALL